MIFQRNEVENPDRHVWVLALSMLFIGICGICYEYTFSKLASDILGNSAKQWAIIIGLMMFFMGIGADLQKYFPDRLVLDQFIFLEMILGILGGFGPSLVLYSFGAIHDHFILIHYFMICSVGLLIGLEIPLLTRINQNLVSSLKNNLGMILKMDYIGSFIGALIWIFILPKFFTLIEMSFFLGIVNLSVALITTWYFKSWVKFKKLIFCAGTISLILLVIGLSQGKRLMSFAEQKLYLDPIVYSETTAYQHLVMTERHNGDVLLYINGQLQFSSTDEYIYHEFLVHPVFSVSKRKKNVLILGGGDGLAVREILKYPDVETITLVDLDPKMTELARKNKRLAQINRGSLNSDKLKKVIPQGIVPGDRVKINQKGLGFFLKEKSDNSVRVNLINIDAYQFIESVSGIFDLIVIDFPDPGNLQLSKLYSAEFYQLLKKKLAHDGLVIQQSTSPNNAKEVFLLIGRTIQSAGFTALPIHQNIPSFGEWGWWIFGHSESFNQKGLKSYLLKESKLPADLTYFTPEVFKSSFVFGKNSLKSKSTEINKLLDDKAFLYYQKAWNAMQ